MWVPCYSNPGKVTQWWTRKNHVYWSIYSQIWEKELSKGELCQLLFNQLSNLTSLIVGKPDIIYLQIWCNDKDNITLTDRLQQARILSLPHPHALQWLCNNSLQEVQFVSPHLNLEWLCYLLWPTECSGSVRVPILSLGFHRSCSLPLSFRPLSCPWQQARASLLRVIGEWSWAKSSQLRSSQTSQPLVNLPNDCRCADPWMSVAKISWAQPRSTEWLSQRLLILCHWVLGWVVMW